MPIEENKIVIVEDDNKVIRFQDITIKNDSVDREEVAFVEKQIAELTEQRESIDKKIAELNAKLEYARKIIEVADKKKAEENSEIDHIETENVADTEQVGG